MKRHGKRLRRGFTLIEVMVSITLLSVLTVGFFMALRVGLNALERSSARMDDNRRVVGVQRLLRRQLAGIMPALGWCGTGISAPIFSGTPNTMRLVTSESLAGAGRGYPQLLEYLIVPSNLPGSWRLIVNETPYAGPGTLAPLCLDSGGLYQLVLRPPVPRPTSFILADHLAAARFSYLYDNPLIVAHQWRPAWPIADAPTPGFSLPAAVRIEMNSVPTEPAHLRLSSMTLRIRVNRMLGEAYPYDDVEPPLLPGRR
jgi:prepilin-type N-terminal cleavage/methylation domain-containing protein